MRNGSRASIALGVVAASLAAGASSAGAQEQSILGFRSDSARTQQQYERAFTDGVSADRIGDASRALSRRPQLVGTDGVRRAQQLSVQRLRSYGLDVTTPTYGVYLSRPRSVSVTMTAPYQRPLATKERGFSWQENFDDVVTGYNAYSPSGDVSGEVVYANYGLPQDYAELEKLGVDVRGKIVLVRYGGSFRGVKAQQAEIRGAKGLLIYSDPEDDGFTRGPVYPQGPWRPADGIQRGSIQYIFEYPGDPLTPGTPSVPGTKRIAPEDASNLPRIPTTPLSYSEAQPLLEALGGPEAPESFKGGLPLTYHVGPGTTQVRLSLDIAYEQTPVSNIVAEIRGTSKPDEKVVLGGHYDGWTYGTSDNTSGWTTVMEVGRSLGRLLRTGWRPQRTIVLAGWDGEEYGLLGSTEWAEQFQRDLKRNAVVYANLDGAGGTSFGGASVPSVDDAITEATKAVTDPRTGKPVYDAWEPDDDGSRSLDRLGSGSDYTVFLDHLGVPSFEIGYSNPASSGTYHSAYDDLYTTEHFLDPGYLGHAATARILGVTALRFANADVLPFHYSDYASAIDGYLTELRKVQAETPGAAQVDMSILGDATKAWGDASRALEDRVEDLLADDNPRPRALARVNAALMKQERALTQAKGLPGRPWFRHQVYAPGLVTGYAVQYLPGMRDAVERGDAATAQAYRDLLLDSLRRATRLAESA